MSLIKDAIDIAIVAHNGQYRKYSKLPYITHPISVALRANRCFLGPEEIAAAYLHDVLEDSPSYWKDVIALGDTDVIRIVKELTKPSKNEEHSDKPRKIRHQIDMEHYSRMSFAAQRLKMLDRINNLEDVFVYYDFITKDWVEEYIDESRDIYSSLRSVNAVIASELYSSILKLETKLVEDL